MDATWNLPDLEWLVEGHDFEQFEQAIVLQYAGTRRTMRRGVPIARVHHVVAISKAPPTWVLPDLERLVELHARSESEHRHTRRHDLGRRTAARSAARKVVAAEEPDQPVPREQPGGSPAREEHGPVTKERHSAVTEEHRRFGATCTPEQSRARATAAAAGQWRAMSAMARMFSAVSPRTQPPAKSDGAPVASVRSDMKPRNPDVLGHSALHVAPAERVLAEWLRQRGIDNVIPQQTVGPYSVGVGAHPVAIEIFGDGRHVSDRYAAHAADRFNYLLDHGWNLAIVWVESERHPLDPAAADCLADFIKHSRRDPGFRRQNRVIWVNGREAAANELDLNRLVVEPPRGSRRPRAEGATPHARGIADVAVMPGTGTRVVSHQWRYPPEFRREVVALVANSGRSITDVARSVGISRATLGNWLKADREARDSGAQPAGLSRSEREELRVLRQLTAQQSIENEILRRAAMSHLSDLQTEVT